MTFLDLIHQYHIATAPEGHHHQRDGWVQFDCPFCSARSGRWRMGYQLYYGYVNCWACGHHGLLETLTALTGESAHNLVRLIKDLEKERRLPEEKRTGTLQLPKGTVGFGSVYATPHRRFLRNRGFNPLTIQQLWNVGALGNTHLGRRLLIPIIYQGECVSWTTRSVSLPASTVVPYISAKPEQESMFHKDLLYGEDYARHTIIVVEGPLDVWAIGPGATCTFGLNYRPKQFMKMTKYPRRIICLDAEKEAQVVARKLCDQLSAFPGETINVVLETGKDASRAKKQEVDKLKQYLED